MWPHLKSYGQDVYLMDFPESRESVEYAIWAINERAGFRARFAGDDAEQACLPGIVVRQASQAEWDAAGIPTRTRALAVRCPVLGAYHVVVKPGVEPSRALILHELAHTMGCWRHVEVSALESLMGSRHVMAPSVQEWAGLTVEDVACVTSGAFWPRPDQADTCFVELADTLDLIAPDALGNYTRLEFVGNVIEGRYEWRQGTTVAGGGKCASVRVKGGAVELLDVRGQSWRGSATIAPSGNLWRLVAAYPL
jgi:hypothetical protein